MYRLVGYRSRAPDLTAEVKAAQASRSKIKGPDAGLFESLTATWWRTLGTSTQFCSLGLRLLFRQTLAPTSSAAGSAMLPLCHEYRPATVLTSSRDSAAELADARRWSKASVAARTSASRSR